MTEAGYRRSARKSDALLLGSLVTMMSRAQANSNPILAFSNHTGTVGLAGPGRDEIMISQNLGVKPRGQGDG